MSNDFSEHTIQTNSNAENNVTLYRITQLEKQYSEFKDEMNEVKALLNKIDKKLSNIPDNGLQCSIHFARIESFEKRVEKLEGVTETVVKKIWFWSGIAAVVLFLLTNFIVPMVKGELTNPQQPQYILPVK